MKAKKLLLSIVFVAVSLQVFSQNWVQVNSGFTYNLGSVFFTDSTNGWAAGPHYWNYTGGTGVILKCSNSVWSISMTSAYPIYSIHFADALTGWAVGLGMSSIAYKYNGNFWTQMSNPPGGGLCSVFFTDSLNGWAGTYNSPDILKYNNNTWTTDWNNSTFSLQSIVSIDFINSQIGWAGGNSVGTSFGYQSTISKHNSSGWSTEYSSSAFGLTRLDMINDTLGWAVSLSGKILKYDGNSWTEFISPTSSPLWGVCFVNPQCGWAVGSNGTILKFNGSWWSYYTSPTTAILRDVFFTDPQHGWIVGDNGTILRFVDNSVGLPEKENLKLSIELYPNPSNGSFQIMSSAKSGTFQLYNTLGDIVNQGLLEGKVTLSGIPQGFYLLKVYADGVVQEKKVVVCK